MAKDSTFNQALETGLRVAIYYLGKKKEDVGRYDRLP
jgi:hypothetical protein